MLAPWSTLRTMLSGPVIALLAGLFLLAPVGRPGVTVSALAVTVLVGAILTGLACAAWLGRIAGLIPLVGRASALRRKSEGAAFLRQRDPDAAGRPRPRAPSAVPATA